MSGTAVASAARQLQPGVPVIFATAYSEHAVRAFELGACDYILKPFDQARIRRTVDRLLELRASPDRGGRWTSWPSAAKRKSF